MGFLVHKLMWLEGWHGARKGVSCCGCGYSIEGVEQVEMKGRFLVLLDALTCEGVMA